MSPLSKKLLFISVVLLIAIGAGIFYFYETAYGVIGNLNLYSGSAEITRGAVPQAGLSGAPVRLGDVISTGAQSRISIILHDGSVVRLEESSSVKVDDLRYKNGKIANAAFELTIGRIWLHLEPLSYFASLDVETPTVVATVRGTAFGATYLERETDVLVSRHKVSVSLKSRPSESKDVAAGNIFTLRDTYAEGDFASGPAPIKAEQIDDWILFNEAEDAKLDGVPGITIVPQAPSSSMITTPPPAAAPIGTKKSPLPAPIPLPPPQIPPPAPSPAKNVTALDLAADKTNISVNDVAQLRVVARYGDGTSADVTNKVSFSQNPGLGLIDNFYQFHPSHAGQTSLTASLGGVTSGAVTITVVDKPAQPQVTALRISFTKKYNSQFTANALPTAQFTATAVYSDGSATDVTGATSWSIPKGTAKGAISASGFYAPGAQGTDTVQGSFGGQSASADITIP